AQIRGVARLQGATAEHLLDDGLYVAILAPRMTLLEGLPVIAEDLLEGVFVDPLPCGGHSAGLYHVLAPRSTQPSYAPSSDPLSSSSSPVETGRRGDSQKGNSYTLHIAPSGRTILLDRRTPSSRRCIRDTPAWACRRYIPHEI